jgi:hypothetical protein
MSRSFVRAEESFREWRKDPKYVAAYNAVKDEFAVAPALIESRGNPEMTQEGVAEATGTTSLKPSRDRSSGE